MPYDKEESMGLASAIIEFVVAEDGPNTEILRSAMYSQVERARNRLIGLRLIMDIFNKVSTYFIANPGLLGSNKA